MLALGLLFILGAAAVTAGAIYDGGEDATFELFGQTIGTSIAGVFLAGVATALVFLIGVWMLMSAMTRSRKKRLERKETSNRQRESVSKIEEERAQLRAENEALQEKLARDRRPDSATTTEATTTEATTTDGTATGSTTAARPDTVAEGHVDHQHTDLTERDAPASSTSGRHRDEI